MKNRNVILFGSLLAALLLFMPSKYSNAQKLISETLKSKTLVEESDGFKWYRYSYEYQVKYKGSIISFTRESAYNLNDRLLIDGAFNIDWIKSDLERSWIKKRYKKYPSKIKEEYSLILEYSPSYGLFVAQKDANGKSILGTFSKDGGCLTYHGQLKDDGVIVGDRIYYFSDNADNTGGSRLTFRKEKYHGYGVMKNGIIIVPFKDYFYMKSEKGIYIGCRYGQKQEKYTDLYTADGKYIGGLSGQIYEDKEWHTDQLTLVFYESPHGEKWLRFNRGTVSYVTGGFHYCITSGRKIDYSNEDLHKYSFSGNVLHLCSYNNRGAFYTSDGVEINVPSSVSSLDLLNTSGNMSIYLSHNGTSDYKLGIIKIEGHTCKVIVEGKYEKGGQFDDLVEIGWYCLYNHDYSVVVNRKGEIMVPLSRKCGGIWYDKTTNKITSYMTIGDSVFHVELNQKGEVIYSKYAYNNSHFQRTPNPPTPNPPSPTPPTPDPPSPNPPKREPVPVQVWKPCGMCGGSGTCYMCNGTGGYYFGPNAKWMECTACHGLKRCTYCAGQGGHYEVEYR